MYSKRFFQRFYFCLPLLHYFLRIWSKKTDSIIKTEFGDINGPGGVFMITKNGKPLYKKAFGKSNLELNTDLNPENVFPIRLYN